MHAYVSSHDGQVSSRCSWTHRQAWLLTLTSGKRADGLMSELYFVIHDPMAGRFFATGPKFRPANSG
jgi:hypothetical protein